MAEKDIMSVVEAINCLGQFKNVWRALERIEDVLESAKVAEASARRNSAEATRLQGEIESRRDTIAGLDATVRAKKSEVEDAKRRLDDDLAKRKDELKVQVATAEREAAVKVEDLKNRTAQAKQEHGQAMATLRAEAASLKAQHDSEIKERVARISDLAQKEDTLNASLEALRRKIA